MNRTFDGMTWPAPSHEMSELAWRLRHAEGCTTRADRLQAAAIINAYEQMIFDPAKKRNRVVAELRQGPNK